MTDLAAARSARLVRSSHVRHTVVRVKPTQSAARYTGLQAASPRASAAARGSSRKRDTKPELALRKALWALGVRYRIDAADLPGRPDLKFGAAHVVVFCDGDFWHGRNLEARLAKLNRGHNGPYWVAKIAANVERGRRHDAELRAAGWLVLRFWESDIATDLYRISMEIAALVRARTGHRANRRRL